jgi:malate dehydrogenase (oxaloacetate-decarboxylating)
MCGAGAAGTAILKLLLHAGAGTGKGSVVVADVDGVLHRDRTGLGTELMWVAEHTNPKGVKGDLRTALRGADVFVGVSAPGLLDAGDVATMATDSVVFALANPDPEIEPGEARQHAAVVATGRSDHPNQINNVLAFPGVFRGLLDAQSRTITLDVLQAAAHAIAAVVSDSELNANYVIPSVFHPEVHDQVAESVRDAVRAAREKA